MNPIAEKDCGFRFTSKTTGLKPALLTALVAGAIAVQAQEVRPIQFSAVPGISLYPRTTLIRGLALNFRGENPQQGVDFGFMNDSTGNSCGFTLALLVNHAQAYAGVAWGLANVSEFKFTGWENGIVNDAQGIVGVQSGWFNFARECHGVQVGFINYASNLRGVQIGLVNIAANNASFRELPKHLAAGFPILNWSF